VNLLVNIDVPDIAQAEAFCRDAFGLKTGRRLGQLAGSRLRFAQFQQQVSMNDRVGPVPHDEGQHIVVEAHRFVRNVQAQCVRCRLVGGL
jgi:hypothetical protein